MSISSLQVTNAVNSIVESRMKSGFIPTVNYIISQLSGFYAQVTPGYPSFKMRQQAYRKLWNVGLYNANLTEIYNDINDFYETIVTQFTVELADFNYAETQRAQLFNQINSLSNTVSNLLLLANDSSGAQYVVSDNFVDNSKIDLNYTTCEIDNDSGMVTIGEQNGISAIDMSQYYGITTFPVVATSQYAPNILSNTLLSGTSFGNAFSNSSGTWQQVVITSIPGDLQVYFTINVSPNNVSGVTFSRIEMTGQSPNPFTVTPTYSSDNINFSSLPTGFTTNINQSATGTTTVWNFAPVTATYIEFLIDKPQSDQTITYNGNVAYQYTFGFTYIGIYKMRYASSSVLYSDAYTITDPNGDPLTIDKATLIVNESIPNGTNIDYYLSVGASGVIDPTLYNWVPISPQNDPAPSQQQIIDFMHVSDLTDIPYNQWNSATYSTPLLTYNGIGFYEVFQFPYTPVKNSVTVYRGVNDWQVVQNYTVNDVNIYYEEHVFGTSQAVQLLYPNFTPLTTGAGLSRGSVTVQNEPGTNPSYTYSNPGDYSVDWVNNLIIRNTNGTISSDPASPNNTVYVTYTYGNQIALPAQYITNIYIASTDGLDLNIVPLTTQQVLNGEFTHITIGKNVNDVSVLPQFHVPQGWSTITTTGEPGTINDVFSSVNGGSISNIVSNQYAFQQPLTEVSWFDLQYNTLKTDHTKYCVTTRDSFTNNSNDGGVTILAVNYKPQTTPWSNGLDMLCDNPLQNSINKEVYDIGYQFISTQTDTIYLKASMTTTSPLITPTLNSYTVKLGY